MTTFTRRLATPLARVFATSALLSATLLGTTFLAGPLLAQTAATAPRAVSDTTSTKAETLEQRISTLHDKLMITAGEEAAWANVAQVMRDNFAAVEKLVTVKKAKAPENMTALDDLVTYQAFAQAHVDGLQKLTSTFKTLYDAMPDAQKKVADETFRDFGRGNAAKRG